MSNISCASGDQTSVSSGGNVKAEINQPPLKRKRNLPGNPDPDAEVIALSPATLMARNRFVCEICNKGFQRDQNLQLHRRGHNLPWKLKQRNNKDVVRKKVYVCPETSCVHHEASRALGDLTGIKKHFSRKHGEKKWKCERCTKRYAVQSDWKAHSKTCGTREYRCDCGTIFSRRDSFITHRAFCDALTEESGKSNAAAANGTSSINDNNTNNHQQHSLVQPHIFNNLTQHHLHAFSMKKEQQQQQQQQQQQIPQWLAPPPPVGLQDPQSRATPIIHMHHQQFTDHHSSSPYHQDLTQPITSLHNSNPNPSYSGFGPTGCAPAYIINSARDDQYVTAADITSPHMSATALLQKAALMGAAAISTKTSSSSLPSMTMTLTRPHQADQVQQVVLSPSKNKDSCLTWEQKSHATTTGTSSHPPPSNPFHQDHMDIDHESTTFEEFEDGFLEEDDDHDRRPCARVGIANDHNGMTRDFLGLRPQLSNTHILNIANLQHNCANVNTTSNSDDHHHELI